jgi:hypothetical protein
MDSGSRSLYTKKEVKHARRPEGPEDPHDGQPAVRGHHERHGRQRHHHGPQRHCSALQTGVVDGAENNPPTLLHGQPLHRRAKFYAQTTHLIIPEIFVMSKVAWDKMSKDEQALVMKFAREAQLEQRAPVGQERG